MSTTAYTEETVTVSTGSKTTLPKQARMFLGVRTGDKICFKITEDGELVVEKAEEEKPNE